LEESKKISGYLNLWHGGVQTDEQHGQNLGLDVVFARLPDQDADRSPGDKQKLIIV